MNSTKIPELNPIQLGAHLFGSWSDPRQIIYENFHIERIENYQSHLKLPILPHRRSVFYFIYVTTGKMIRTKLLNQYEILPNCFFFLAANVTTSIEFVAPETSGFYCHFQPGIFQQINPQLDLLIDFPFFELTTEPVIKTPNSEQLIHLMQTLEKEYHKNQIKRFELIPLYLITLLAEVKLANTLPLNNQPVKDTAALLTMRYKKALSELIYEKSKVFEFAEHLSVTPNHLNKSVRSATGKSAYELLSEMKVIEAKVLLKQTTLGIGEIAYKVGKMSHSDFSRFFKAKTSLTPKQYRKHSL